MGCRALAEETQQETGGMVNLVRRLSYEKPQRPSKRRRLDVANCPSPDGQVSPFHPSGLLGLYASVILSHQHAASRC